MERCDFQSDFLYPACEGFLTESLNNTHEKLLVFPNGEARRENGGKDSRITEPEIVKQTTTAVEDTTEIITRVLNSSLLDVCARVQKFVFILSKRSHLDYQEPALSGRSASKRHSVRPIIHDYQAKTRRNDRLIYGLLSRPYELYRICRLISALSTIARNEIGPLKRAPLFAY